MQKNRCITDRTEWTHPIQDPPSMACTLCGFHCSHLAQFHRHTTEEHRAPPAHLPLTLDSSDEDTRAAPTRRRADQPGENQQASRWWCSKQHQHASVVRQLGPQERPRTSPLGISHRKLLISIPISSQAGHARTCRTSSAGSSAPRRRTRHRGARQQAQTFTLRRWPPRWSHRQGGLHRWHSSGGKEDDRPDEEGQPATSIDIIGQARPEFQEHISRLLKTEKEEQTTTHPSSEPSEPKPTLGSHRSRGRKCVRFFSIFGRASRYSDARIK